MNRVRILATAEQEIMDAVVFYELQVCGLGGRFLGILENAISDIAESPGQYPVIGSGIHRRMLHRFPYGILYRIDPGEVVVLAVAHLHRRPCYWEGRT